jgi:hypothetical protein
VRRLTLGIIGVLVFILAGCGGGGTVTPPADQASFDVTGTWKGTAVDEDTTINVTLVLNNNGGSLGMELAGTLTLEGIGTFPFTSSYIYPLTGAQRISDIDASDSQGFTYSLGGNFTSKRMDNGQLQSSNPAVDVDAVFLTTTLVKQ